MTLNDPPEFNQRRWDRLLVLLSMDVVRPFFELMGLLAKNPDVYRGVDERGAIERRTTNAEKLQQVLRRQIIATRKGTNIDQVVARLTVQDVIRAVEEVLGADISSRLIWWSRNIFHGDSTTDNIALRRWNTILHHCRKEPTQWAQLCFPDGIGSDQFLLAHNLDEYHKIQDKVDAQPLSDWDLHLYALNLYDDLLYEGDLYRVPDGPRLYVKPTVRAYQVYQFWTRVLKLLNLKQREQLLQTARRIVQVNSLLKDPESLPHPSVMEILL